MVFLDQPMAQPPFANKVKFSGVKSFESGKICRVADWGEIQSKS